MFTKQEFDEREKIVNKIESHFTGSLKSLPNQYTSTEDLKCILKCFEDLRNALNSANK